MPAYVGESPITLGVPGWSEEATMTAAAERPGKSGNAFSPRNRWLLAQTAREEEARERG